MPELDDSDGRGDGSERLAAAVGRLALPDGAAPEARLQVATAESLTGGELATRLGASEGSGDWFAGAVVAYDTRVKQEVLGVDEGPVVTSRCAAQMAEGARRLLGVDFAVSTTGAGGPGPEEGKPAGTVHLAVAGPDGTTTERRDFEGEPDEVVRRTVVAALELLEGRMAEYRSASS